MRIAAIKVVLLLGAFGGLSGCETPEELDGDDINGGMGWEDLLTHRSDSYERFEVTELTSAVEALPQEVVARPGLAQLAIGRALENPVPFEGGVFGMVGSAKMFIGTSDQIPDDTRLYWVLVKVLSEKYGCFMVHKQNLPGDMVKVKCRDRRQIVFWKTRGDGWFAFQSRQFDKEGFEIQVRKRQIVRISDRAML